MSWSPILPVSDATRLDAIPRNAHGLYQLGYPSPPERGRTSRIFSVIHIGTANHQDRATLQQRFVECHTGDAGSIPMLATIPDEWRPLLSFRWLVIEESDVGGSSSSTATTRGDVDDLARAMELSMWIHTL